MDPTKITVDDLTNVENDHSLASCRRYLRKHYSFEQGISKVEINKMDSRDKKRENGRFRLFTPQKYQKECAKGSLLLPFVSVTVTWELLASSPVPVDLFWHPWWLI